MNANLGRTGTDKITGFTGIVTGYVQYLTGCHQYLLAPKTKDGAAVEPHWFDEQRIDFAGSALRLDNGATPGCDKAPPVR